LAAAISVAVAVAGAVHYRITADTDRNPGSLAERLGEDSTAHDKSCFSDIVVDAGPEGRFSEWPSMYVYYRSMNKRGGHQNE
jgi:hypothetical protein